MLFMHAQESKKKKKCEDKTKQNIKQKRTNSEKPTKTEMGNKKPS